MTAAGSSSEFSRLQQEHAKVSEGGHEIRRAFMLSAFASPDRPYKPHKKPPRNGDKFLAHACICTVASDVI